MISILQWYCTFSILCLALYTIRHCMFTFNRSICKQKSSYDEILDSDLPTVTIFIPMHNEELVVNNILNMLLNEDFGSMQVQIIGVNDHSTDKTQQILEEYAKKYPHFTILERNSGLRGKPAALNDALDIATGEVILVFDADYLPTQGIVRNLAVNFKDPEVSAVMGRVIPFNESANILTELIGMERSGGYQVDQQARFNMGLIPQYGGTVGGIRKSFMEKFGGFDPFVLAEDTDITYKSFIYGWCVQYANGAECFEEAPEDWGVRARQIQRWSRGHNQVFFKQFKNFMTSPFLSFKQRLDGVLLLGVYMIPGMLMTTLFAAVILFFMGDLKTFFFTQYVFFYLAYHGFGNFAPFYQICMGLYLDGERKRIRLLPLMAFKFTLSMFYSSKGFAQAILDILLNRIPTWNKTQRFRSSRS